MRILKTYIITEHIKPFLLALSIFGFILFMSNMTQLMKLVFTQNVEATVVVRLLLYLVPFIASYSLPMAVLLAVLLAYARLNSDNEIAAIKASGVDPVWLTIPTIALSFLISLLCVSLNNTILPKATYARRELIGSLATREPTIFFQQGTLIEDFPNYLIYIRHVKGRNLRRIHIFQMKGDAYRTSIEAQEGEILPNTDKGTVTLKLRNGTIEEADPTDPDRHDRSTFTEYYLPLELPPLGGSALSKRPKDMTIRELQGKIAELQLKKMDTSPLQTEIGRKLSLAFASLSFALIAAPLGLRVKKGARSAGFGLSLLLIIIYYILFTGCQILAERGVVPATFIWTPNILLAAVGCFLMLKSR